MITTVTLNTALDKLYLMEKLEMHTVMRVKTVINTPGGKGINVSKVSALAGEEVITTGFIGGFNGDYLNSMLQKQRINTAFTKIGAETRSCINIREIDTGKQTEFLEPGAEVTEDDLNRFYQDFKDAVAKSQVVTISGSVPKGTPVNFYNKLIRHVKTNGKKIFVDTSGQLLIESVKEKPTFIKPNTDEIEQLLQTKVTSKKQLIEAAVMLQKQGIEIVVVSQGKDGSIIACDSGVYEGKTPDIPVVNTVGCGDSMVAGFAVSAIRGYSMEESIRFATAISTANAMNIETGNFRQEDLEYLLPRVSVNKIMY